MNTTQLNNYQQWQLERYGNIEPEILFNPDGSVIGKPTREAAQRQAEYFTLNLYTQEPQDCQEVKEQEEYEAEEWMNDQAENDLWEHEY